MFAFSNIIKFDCHGSWKINHHNFNPNGFLNSYNSTVIYDFENINNEIVLFGKKCEFWSALDTDSDWLINMSRKALLQLRDIEIDVPKPYEKNISNQEAIAIMNVTAQCLRSDLSVFLYYIDYYLRVCLRNAKMCNITNDKTSTIESILDALRIVIHELDRYFFSEQFLIQCSFPNEGLPCNAAYQLFHCCLDFRWFYILIRYKLKDVKNQLKLNPPPEMNDSENDSYLLLMSELVFTSAVKYKYLENGSLIKEILICPCIKEIWVLLFKYLGLESFWDNFNQILRALLEIESPPNNQVLKNLCVLYSFKFKSKNAEEFTINLLKEIAILKEYIICKTDYPLNADSFIPFYDNVKQYLHSNPSEKSLRSVLRVTASIMNYWDLEKELVLVLFLEYFHKKILSGFQTNQTVGCADKNGSNFLNEVKNRFLSTAEPNENESSFELFLRLIAVHVQKSRFEGILMKSLYSRMHIKFDVLKNFKSYSAIVLYETCSLFLTAAIAFGVEKEVKKLRDLIVAWNYLDLSIEKKVVKWKTLVACLLLLAENGYNTKEIIDDILTDVRLALSIKEKTLMHLVIECIQVLIENRNNYMSAIMSISSLAGDWIEKYVTLSETHETGIILAIFNPVIADLREGAEWWSGEDTEEIKKQLLSHVLSVVKMNVYPCFATTAAQFFSFFIKSKNWSQAYSLYNTWVQAKDSVGSVPSEFIISYNEIEGDVSKLGLFKRDYETDIVKCFIKYHFLNGPTRTSDKLCSIVKSLPTVARCIADVKYTWLEEDDNLISFIRLFGGYLKICSAKLSLKLLFNDYFSELGEWCETGLTSNAPKSIINNIYHCCARLVAECHCVIYEENQPSVLLAIVEKVFLPVSKCRNYSELPLSYAEAFNKHVPLFIRGLLKLNANGSPYIRNVVQDLIYFIFPTSPAFAHSGYESHPFYNCLHDIEIVRQFSSILEIMFLTKGCRSDDSQGENCIRLFSLVSCPFARDIIFSNVIETLLNCLIENDCSSGIVNSALDYINKCLNESPEARISLKLALKRISANESLYYPGDFENLCKRLGKVCPVEVLGLLPSYVENEVDVIKW